MRKPHPGKGAIKLMVEIVTISKKKKEVRSYWQMVMNVKQARDFVHRTTGKLLGQNLYRIEKPKRVRVPTIYKAKLIDTLAHVVFDRDFYIQLQIIKNGTNHSNELLLNDPTLPDEGNGPDPNNEGR